MTGCEASGAGERGTFRGLDDSRGLHSGDCESKTWGGTVARRTNYGFEKRQRELRKQKRKQEKAERRREEATDATPDDSEASDETPPQSGAPDNG